MQDLIPKTYSISLFYTILNALRFNFITSDSTLQFSVIFIVFRMYTLLAFFFTMLLKYVLYLYLISPPGYKAS